MNVKYPNIKVKLLGESETLNILTRVQSAMKKANVPADGIRAFAKETVGKDGQDLISTCSKWVAVV